MDLVRSLRTQFPKDILFGFSYDAAHCCVQLDVSGEHAEALLKYIDEEDMGIAYKRRSPTPPQQPAHDMRLSGNSLLVL